MAEVRRTIDIDVPPAKIWELIGVYENVHNWHPSAIDCKLIEKDGIIKRHIILADGHGEILERLKHHDDDAMLYSYEVLASPMPVTDYHASLGVEPAGDGARVIWSVRYQPNGTSEQEANKIITGIFDKGLNAIKQRFDK